MFSVGFVVAEIGRWFAHFHYLPWETRRAIGWPARREPRELGTHLHSTNITIIIKTNVHRDRRHLSPIIMRSFKSKNRMRKQAKTHASSILSIVRTFFLGAWHIPQNLTVIFSFWRCFFFFFRCSSFDAGLLWNIKCSHWNHFYAERICACQRKIRATHNRRKKVRRPVAFEATNKNQMKWNEITYYEQFTCKWLTVIVFPFADFDNEESIWFTHILIRNFYFRLTLFPTAYHRSKIKIKNKNKHQIHRSTLWGGHNTVGRRYRTWFLPQWFGN